MKQEYVLTDCPVLQNDVEAHLLIVEGKKYIVITDCDNTWYATNRIAIPLDSRNWHKLASQIEAIAKEDD